MKNLLLLCALLTTTVLLSGQQFDSIRYGTIGIHYQQLDLTDFNAFAKDRGFPILEESMIDLSGGLTRQNQAWKNYYFFALGLNEETAINNGPETRYQYAGVGWSTSYNLLNRLGVWFIGPELQLLFRGEQAVLAGVGQAADPQAAVDVDYVKFTRFNVPIDLGINLHHRIQLSPNKSSFVTLALRAGYRFESDSGWQLDQAVDIERSGINAGGLYAGLRIGALLQSPK